MKFLSSFVAFIRRPEALGSILSAYERTKQAYFGAFVVIFGAPSFVKARLLDWNVKELVFPVMGGVTCSIIVLFDVPNNGW